MRILYGVVGEGMGHATRSKVLCEYLQQRGHEVKIVVSGRAHGFLARSFDDVVEIKGLTIRYVDNALDRDGTLARNLLAAPEMLFDNALAYFENVVHFEPDVVFTDFDSFAYLFAKRHRLPIVSVDNQQIVARCKHDDFVKKGAKLDYQLTRAFVRAKVPACDHYIVTSFFYPQIRKKHEDDTTLIPPMLRKPVVDARPMARIGEHVLVYQTSQSDTKLLQMLNSVERETFIVYGLGRSERVGNCVLKPFSEQGFVHDLATSRAVVTNGGLSLLGESIYLGKPVYSVPVRNQFEQVMNARYLEELGYGLAADALDPDVLRLFLRESAKYASRLKKHDQDGNEKLYDAVDHLLHKFEKRARKREKRLAARE